MKNKLDKRKAEVIIEEVLKENSQYVVGYFEDGEILAFNKKQGYLYLVNQDKEDVFKYDPELKNTSHFTSLNPDIMFEKEKEYIAFWVSKSSQQKLCLFHRYHEKSINTLHTSIKQNDLSELKIKVKNGEAVAAVFPLTIQRLSNPPISFFDSPRESIKINFHNYLSRHLEYCTSGGDKGKRFYRFPSYITIRHLDKEKLISIDFLSFFLNNSRFEAILDEDTEKSVLLELDTETSKYSCFYKSDKEIKTLFENIDIPLFVSTERLVYSSLDSQKKTKTYIETRDSKFESELIDHITLLSNLKTLIHQKVNDQLLSNLLILPEKKTIDSILCTSIPSDFSLGEVDSSILLYVKDDILYKYEGEKEQALIDLSIFPAFLKRLKEQAVDSPSAKMATASNLKDDLILFDEPTAVLDLKKSRIYLLEEEFVDSNYTLAMKIFDKNKETLKILSQKFIPEEKAGEFLMKIATESPNISILERSLISFFKNNHQIFISRNKIFAKETESKMSRNQALSLSYKRLNSKRQI